MYIYHHCCALGIMCSLYIMIHVLLYINPNTVFDQSGVDVNKPLILTCGGAVVAPFVAFAASLIGLDLPVYDVS